MSLNLNYSISLLLDIDYYRTDFSLFHFNRSPSVKSTGSNLSQLATSLRASMRHKVSYASAMLIHHREEGRAATVTILVLASMLICWSPYFVVSSLQVLWNNFDQCLSWIQLFAIFCVLCNSVASPILYAFR
jgi:hypothetical protein